MENIIVAASNLYAILPIAYNYQHNHLFNAFILTCAMAASIAYHLIETHKHNMPGMPIFRSYEWHNFFINIDRFFAFACIFILFDINNILKFNGFILVALLHSYLSEVYFRSNDDKYKYILTHIIWHIMAFQIAYIFSLKYI